MLGVTQNVINKSAVLTNSTVLTNLQDGRIHLSDLRDPTDDPLAVLTLYDNGTIADCNHAAGTLLDCMPSRLKLQHVSIVLPQLSNISLMAGEKINPNLRFLSRIGFTFDVVGLTGIHIASAVFFNEIEDVGRHFLRIIVRPVLLDSFI